MKSKEKNPFPQINLKAGNTYQDFPEDGMQYELVLEYKRGGTPREFVSPVRSIEIIDDIIAITNTISEYRYKYETKHLKAAFLIPIGVGGK